MSFRSSPQRRRRHVFREDRVTQRCKRCGKPPSSSSQTACAGENHSVTRTNKWTCRSCYESWSEVEVVPDSLETRWADVQEFREIWRLQEAHGVGGQADTTMPACLMALELVKCGKRLNVPLSEDMATFVREQLGEAPYPTPLEIMMRDPNFAEQYAKAQSGEGQQPPRKAGP